MRLAPTLSRLACALAALASAAVAKPPTDLAPTPPMGWNSWNWHGKKDITETVVRETIDAMVSTGLRDVWAKKDLGTQRKAVTKEIPARSGAFLLLSPAASERR